MKNTIYRKILSVTFIIGAVLGVMILQLVLLRLMGFALKMVFGISWDEFVNGNTVFKTLFYIVYSVAGIGLFGSIFHIINKYSFLKPLNDKKSSFFERTISVKGLIVLGVALQALSYGVLNIIYSFARDTEVFKNYNELMKNIDGSTTWIIFFYTALLGPVLEEIIFRGLCIDFGRYGFSTVTSLIISAVCFGIFHGNIIQCCYAIPLGLVLGYVKICSGRLRYSIILHITINMSAIIIIPVLAALISQIASGIVLYGIMLVVGILLTAMWFLGGKEKNPPEEQDWQI